MNQKDSGVPISPSKPGNALRPDRRGHLALPVAPYLAATPVNVAQYPRIASNLLGYLKIGRGRDVLGAAQASQRKLKLGLARQGNSARIAVLDADIAPGRALKPVRYDRPAGLGIPLKDVVGTGVETLKVLPAEVNVDGRKPGEFLPQVVE